MLFFAFFGRFTLMMLIELMPHLCECTGRKNRTEQPHWTSFFIFFHKEQQKKTPRRTPKPELIH